jgi:hypothetical protein
VNMWSLFAEDVAAWFITLDEHEIIELPRPVTSREFRPGYRGAARARHHSPARQLPPALPGSNALGNLAGTVTPFVGGKIKDMTGAFRVASMPWRASALLAAMVTLRYRRSNGAVMADPQPISAAMRPP